MFFLCFSLIEAKSSNLTPQEVVKKSKEIMKAHATQKELSSFLIDRILTNYLELLDPTKTYFIESDIEKWIHPTEQLLEEIIKEYKQGNFKEFEDINQTLFLAINRRREIDKTIDYSNLPLQVHAEEFKEMKWAKSENELKTRLIRIRALQLETASKMSAEMRDKSIQRITKRQTKYEEEILNPNLKERQYLILSNILKATASALDSHTVYFSPSEATQFMIGVQQRLYGIGAQLRDDINGFTIVKIVEGGPAALNKEIKKKDRIVAVNGEPVVGMDISDAVELIRGEANTAVVLTIIREIVSPEGLKQEKKLDVTLLRGEVVLKETRYKTSYEPFGKGIIAYLKLYSFYQDEDSSSATDLENEINKLKQQHDLLGVILDLRYNSGGLLSQAVAVTGLFITKGIVASIKDENGKIQHLRHLEGIMAWDGPLAVLTNRMSASASEIVAQTLQDYGRALILGDDHTYGKGSYQTFTLTTANNEIVNPEGEYKVTRGRYYTVSGKTPQLKGVLADVVIPGPLSESEIGEKFAKYPLESDQIEPNFDDNLSDIPFLQRDKIRKLYKFGLQEKLNTYTIYLDLLKENEAQRLQSSKNYQNFIKEMKKKEDTDLDHQENFGQNDLQLEQAYQVMKDLILVMKEKGVLFISLPKENLSFAPFKLKL